MNARHVSARTLSLSALALAITGAVLYAGPLDPPAGPVSSTYKTLNEVEPRIAINAANTPGDPLADPSPSVFKITQPGSYYLTGNISGVAGMNGIEISASNVTLDLMGFRVLGVIGSLNGILVNATQTNLTIRNGSVRSFGGDGLSGFNGDSMHVIDFTARNCTGRGVAMGEGCSAVNVIADSNSGSGIATLGGSTLATCVSRNNGGDGIAVDFNASITNCTATANTGDGFNVGSGCLVVSSMASGNGDDGFATLNSSTFTSCQAFSNIGDGFDSQGGGCVMTSCTTKSNNGYGVRAGGNSTITQCAASLNLLSGISVGTGSVVGSCASASNTVDGIRVTSDCVVLSNTCSGNGFNGTGAGIHATSSDNRIEGNNCAGSDTGIDVDVAGNVIIRNTCSGNTINWVIAANNVCGPILDRTTPASAAISGNSAPDSTGSTHPNANFTY